MDSESSAPVSAPAPAAAPAPSGEVPISPSADAASRPTSPEAQSPRFFAARFGYLALVLFVFAAILRIAGAWGGRAIADMDSSVVALMARHMALGTDFPVFFYGQAYMGSLEPLVSAACIKLFGDYGFAVTLGPAIVSLLALVALWLWARKAAPAPAALLALALAAVGPLGYWVFQFAPRGGYMVALLVDALVLSLSATLASRWWHDKPGGIWRVAVLGLVAGLGLWTDLIVVPALLAAVVLLLVGMRGRLRRHWRALVAGVAGTLAGASPWIVHALRHGGNFFALPPVPRAPFLVALHSTWLRFLNFQGDLRPQALDIALAVVPLVLAVLGVIAWLRHCRKLSAERNFAVAGAVLFCGAFVGAFVFSGFNQANTGRYWVPFWPPLVLLAAWSPFVARSRPMRIAVVAAIAALFATHLYFVLCGISAACLRARNDFDAQATALAEVRALGGDAVLAPRDRYFWNYAWHEEYPVSDAEVPFHESTRLAVEAAENPVYSSRWLGVPVLFGRLGLETETSPSRAFLVPRSRPAFGPATACGFGVPLSRGDGASAECPVPAPGDGAPPPVLLQFAFRGIPYEMGFPLVRNIAFSVDFLRDGTWNTVVADAPLFAVFWSGTRAYLGDGSLQFCPVDGPLPDAFRVSFKGDSSRFPEGFDWAFLPAPGPAETAAAGVSSDSIVTYACAACRQNPATRVFATRYLSNRLRESGIAVECLPGLDPRLFPGLPVPPERPAFPVNAPVLVLVPPCTAPLVRGALDREGVPFAEFPTVPHPPYRSSPAVVFQIPPRPVPPPLVWNGLWFSPA